MNLKKRLIIANSATVIIPIIITVFTALAFVFLYSRIFGNDLGFQNFQRLTEIKLEVMNSEKSIIEQTPETLEEKSFQADIKQKLAEIGGEVIILKNNRVIFASRDFSKIDLEKCIDAGNQTNRTNHVTLNDESYNVETIDLNFKEGTLGKVLLLGPLDQTEFNLKLYLLILGILFVFAFALTNSVVSYQLSHSIIKPLNNLKQAAAEIRSGNLDFQIVEEGDQELRELCRDLELMRIKLKDLIHTQLKYEENRKMLISSISHDLRTPVTSIKGYVEGIIDGIANTPQKREKYLRTIYSKAEQVDQMINDLLLYAKLDLNQIPFNFKKTDIEAYIKDCLSECEPEAENNNIKLAFTSQLQETRYVLLDQERMRRVIANILDNAQKYMDKNPGEINISLRETNSSLIVEFQDNGSGISEKDLPHIFERFYRSDASRNEVKGSGLGLAIAKQIIEGHHGRIWVISHGNEGTSIMVSMKKL